VRIFRWIACAGLAACTTPQPVGDHITVVWNRVDDVQAACQQLSGQVTGQKQIFAVRGCSKWNETDRAGQRICSIYAPMPRTETDKESFATLGHELMHCFDGNWHDKWGRMNPQEGQAAAGGSAGRKGAAARN